MLKGLLVSKEQEIKNNRTRFQRVEAAELIEEIARSRLAIDAPGKVDAGDNAGSLAGAAHAVSNPFTSNLAEGDSNGLIQTLRSQLLFENYQKQQLVHRLGANLREQVQAGGLEAERQNLVRGSVTDEVTCLYCGFTDASRPNPACADKRLRSHAQQSPLGSCRVSWAPEWVFRGSAVNVTSENLARAEKRIFELEAEERFRRAEEQKQQTEVQQRADGEATVAEPVTNDEELRVNPDAVLATRGKQDARPTDAVLDQDASNIESAADEA